MMRVNTWWLPCWSCYRVFYAKLREVGNRPHMIKRPPLRWWGIPSIHLHFSSGRHLSPVRMPKRLKYKDYKTKPL
jgi:hypothetical protein